MPIISKIDQHQQKKIQKLVKTSSARQFFNQLTSSELLATVDNLLPQHRERYYPPTETLTMFLAQALMQIARANTRLITHLFSAQRMGCRR